MLLKLYLSIQLALLFLLHRENGDFSILMKDIFYLQDDIVEGMAKEYLRPAGVPSCRDGGAIHKEASYKDGKILKTYRTSNRCSSLFSFEICFEVVGNPLKHMMQKL